MMQNASLKCTAVRNSNLTKMANSGHLENRNIARAPVVRHLEFWLF